MRIIGITGGIGAGKSVVSRILALRGIPVFDCDWEAKCLMEPHSPLLKQIQTDLQCCITDSRGCLVKPRLAEIIFSDEVARRKVNSLVHKAVKETLKDWIAHCKDSPIAIESAILHTSGLTSLTNEIWVVEAPESLRITRVMERSALSEEEIRARMDSQRKEFQSLPPENVRRIDNSGTRSLLAQIDNLLDNPIV